MAPSAGRATPDQPDTHPTAPPPDTLGVRHTRTASPRLLAAGAILVLALFVLVFVGLPRVVDNDPARSTGPTDESSVTVPATAPATERSGIAVRARLEAERAVARFLAAREAVEARAVQRWAAAEYEAAVVEADRGEAALGEGDYALGTALYRGAADRLEALEARADEVYAQALEAGAGALARAEPDAAEAAFDLALAITPDSAPAEQGRQRALALRTALERLAAGAELEADGDLDGAQSAYAEAVAAMPGHAPAIDALARVERRQRDRMVRGLISDGLAALEAGRLDAAERALSAAAAARPGDPAVADGLARVTAERRERRIATLRAEAGRLAAAEQWADATAAYRQALEIDPNLSFARRGAAQGERMADIHARLAGYAAEDHRLQSVAVRDELRALLLDLQAAEERGPRLSALIADAERALDRASTPVDVRIESDGQTEVVIYRVGRLGRFRRQDLQLTPGRYVAVGTRPGYRDVRREIEVAVDGPPPYLYLACEEPV